MTNRRPLACRPSWLTARDVLEAGEVEPVINRVVTWWWLTANGCMTNGPTTMLRCLTTSAA